MSVYKQHELYFKVLSALGSVRAHHGCLLTLVLSPLGRRNLFSDRRAKKLINIPPMRMGPVTFNQVPVFIEPTQEELFRVVTR